jgi:hypothetical protein
MTDLLKLYFATTPENADAILRHGFGGEVILKDQTVSGDWSKDRAIVEVSFACDISQFALPRAGMPYRTWRIPATFINSHAKSRTIHGRLIVSPKFKHYVERLRPPPPDQIAKMVDSAIIEKMIDCLQRMRPRQQTRAAEAKKRARRSPMDRGRAKQIVERALAVTWKWIAEDQYRDASRFRHGDERKHAWDASDLIFQLNSELELAAPRNSALNEMLERPAKTSDFDSEMLEEWLSDIAALTGAKDGGLTGGLTSRDILYAWDTMLPIVRSNVERRLRNEPTGSIRAALNRIPVLIYEELGAGASRATNLPHVRVASMATNLPHVRVLQRRLNFLLGRSGLGIGAMEQTYEESPSQEFIRLAQEAFGIGAAARVSRHAVKDENRRQWARKQGPSRSPETK